MIHERKEATVSALYLRPEKTAPPKEAFALTLIAGSGIENDCHAHPLSPRQVLIVLSNAYNDFDLPSATLRENILLEPNLEFHDSELNSGDTLSFGKLELRITFQCEPCGRLNKLKPRLSRDIQGRRGWLAKVVSSGTIRRNDTLHLTKNVYPPFSEDWHERVLNVARLLPANRSLSYLKLALLAGVANGYCRAFPRLLRTHNLPTERIIPSSIGPLPLPEWNGMELFNPETKFHV